MTAEQRMMTDDDRRGLTWLDVLTVVALIGLIALAVAWLTGCSGGYLVPGGQGVYEFSRNADGSPNVRVQTNKDTSLESLVFNPSTGQIEVRGLNANASALGAQQAGVQVAVTAQILGVVNNAMGLVAQVAPWVAAAGGQIIQSPATGQLQVVQAARSAAGQVLIDTALARIDACPVMTPDQKGRLRELVLAVPIGRESLVALAVESLTNLTDLTNVLPIPEPVNPGG